ncbi:response regulator [Roseomonas sp. CCTCC AB2023176]|uniref:response regulator n=1 Tax=Roseomonas sp. CCTCC AB2023176 TaxID=3342640 RepID=UPI0035E19CBA
MSERIGAAAAGQGGSGSEPSGGEGPQDAVGSSGVRVLVVEDDASVRDHAVRLVRNLGYTVREAADGHEALRLLIEDPRCDILFSDVVMPGMSGGQLAQAAKLMLPRLAVVFVTGHHADPLVEQLRREGAAAVLPKPYRRQAVASALQRALERR